MKAFLTGLVSVFVGMVVWAAAPDTRVENGGANIDTPRYRYKYLGPQKQLGRYGLISSNDTIKVTEMEAAFLTDTNTWTAIDYVVSANTDGSSSSGGTSLYANGSIVTNANFKDSATATITVGSVTNITINPTNIANAQIAAGAAIAFSKLAGVAPATTGSAVLKANGAGGFADGVPGTDYIGATSGSAIQKASSGGLAAASLGSDYDIAANPTATIGLTAVNGSATTQMRSDAAPALSQAIAPTWTGQHAFSAASGTPVTITPAANTTALTVNGGSVTGSGTTASEVHSWTWNTSGAPDGVQIKFTNTASAATSKPFHILGGAAGATELLNVDPSGNITVVGQATAGAYQAQSGGYLYIISKGYLLATADGAWVFSNNSNNGLTSLSLGPDNAAPTAVILKSGSATGTDHNGADLSFGGGNGTGTGPGGAVKLRTTPFSTTGSTQNTPVDRYIVAPEKTLTDAATSVFEIALTTLRTAGGVIRWTIEAGDGTDVQSYSGVTVYSVVNKGGSYTKTVSATAADTEAKAVSAGTLTAAWSILDGTNKVTLQFTPAGSLTETTYRLFFTIENNSRQAITLL